MTDKINIIEPLDSVKHQDTIDIHTKRTSMDERKRMYNKINDMEQDYLQNKRKPFCRYSARDDFRKEQDELWRLKGNINGATKPEDVKVPGFDLESYGKSSYFNLIAEVEWKEMKLLDGLRTEMRVGIKRVFASKRGARITIHIPDSELKKKRDKE